MTSQDCPAHCTEKFRAPCCPWCPLVDADRPPYGTLELAAHLLVKKAEREATDVVADTPDWHPTTLSGRIDK